MISARRGAATGIRHQVAGAWYYAGRGLCVACSLRHSGSGCGSGSRRCGAGTGGIGGASTATGKHSNDQNQGKDKNTCFFHEFPPVLLEFEASISRKSTFTLEILYYLGS